MTRRALLFLAILVSTGCATYDAADLNVDRARGYPTRFSWPSAEDKFTLIAHVPTDPGYLEQYYGVNLRAHNIQPVELYFKNGTSDLAFEINIDDLELQLPGGGSGFEIVTAAEVQNRAGFSQWRSVLAWLFFLPGPFSNMDIAAANRKMLDDYGAKELPRPILYLAAGEQTIANGVVFLRPRDGKLLRDLDLSSASLEVPVDPNPGSEPFVAEVFLQ